MNSKLFLSFLIGLMFLVSIVPVFAQIGDVENQIEGAVDNLENNITKIKEFGEKDKWDFIGSQWKEFLLKNKAIAGVDAFFTKINLVFVVLFAHGWAISLEMLFIFLLWLFTLISLYSYLKLKLENGWTKLFISLGVTLILAHSKIFNYVSESAVKVIFYKSSAGWRSLMLILVLGGLVIYLMLNRTIRDSLQKAREKRDKELLKEKVEKTEKFQENMVKVAKQVEK